MSTWKNVKKYVTFKLKDDNKPTNWIEESISKGNIKYYEYKHFKNIQEIGTGGFGKVYRANWKSPYQYFALKSLLDIDDVGIKELVREVIAVTKCI